MHTGGTCGLALYLMIAAAGTLQAQQRTPAAAGDPDAPPRIYISVNGGAQVTRTDFNAPFSFSIYREDAAVESRHDVPAGPLVDVGAGIRVAGGLAVGAAVTRYQQRGSAAIDARIPHPLRPEEPRRLVDTIADLDRVETAVHAQIAWLAPVTRRLTIAVFGGPAFFRVEQDLVTGLDLREAYPFDEVSLQRAGTAMSEDSAVGFNAGADFIFRLRESFGVGGLARYSRGALDLDAGGRTVSVDAGGLQLSGGVRWVF